MKINNGVLCVQTDKSERSLPQEAVRKITEYINENFCSDIKLEDISAAVKYNKYYICRVFKQHTNKTVQNYILDLRIDKAKALLEDSVPVAEIVYGCGFSSQSYFCHIFKIKTGKTPLQYRYSVKK